MSWYYSPATRGFYNDEIHEELPDDALPITDEERRALLDGQTAGKEIAPGRGGKPEAIDRPQPSAEELAAREAARIEEELRQVDLDSIRAIREYLTGDETAKAEAVTRLMNLEEGAKEKRGDLAKVATPAEEIISAKE